MHKYAVSAISVLPAVAENGFWIVRGADKECTVVETEPAATETTVTRVGKDVYVTREEVQADIATVCTDD